MISGNFKYSSPFETTSQRRGYNYKISLQKSDGRKVAYLFEKKVISEDTFLKFKRLMEHPNFNSSLNTETFRSIVLFFVDQMSTDKDFDAHVAEKLVRKINTTTADVLASFFASSAGLTH